MRPGLNSEQRKSCRNLRLCIRAMDSLELMGRMCGAEGLSESNRLAGNEPLDYNQARCRCPRYKGSWTRPGLAPPVATQAADSPPSYLPTFLPSRRTFTQYLPAPTFLIRPELLKAFSRLASAWARNHCPPSTILHLKPLAPQRKSWHRPDNRPLKALLSIALWRIDPLSQCLEITSGC